MAELILGMHHLKSLSNWNFWLQIQNKFLSKVAGILGNRQIATIGNIAGVGNIAR